jgi:hypothetical protein
MKRRVLQINHISEEQLKYLLTHVQWLCMKKNRYFIVVEDIDWYIVLLVLCHKGVIVNEGKMPFKAFYGWIKQNEVPLYECHPTPKRLSYISRRVSDADFPWLSKHAPKYAIKKWEALYEYFERMIDGEIANNND